MADTLDTFTEIETFEVGDLVHVKRGTGPQTDKKMTEANLKTAITGGPDPAVVYGGHLLYGSVTWLSGLTFAVSAASYVIDGVTYFSAPDTVTLDAADATNPRIDVIYVDTGGLVGKITGTPASDPAKPEVDPTTQLELTFITVAALATEPEDVGASLLYGENAGDPTEWDATESTAGARIDLADTSDPYAGTNAILFNAAANNDYVELASGSPETLLVVGDMDSLETHIKVAAWGNKRLRVAFYNGATRVSAWVNIQDGLFGFDSSNTVDYQTVTIPKPAFSFTDVVADSVRFEVRQGGGTISALLDQVRIQTGGATITINIGLTEDELVNNVRRFNAQQYFGAPVLVDGPTVVWDLDQAPVAQLTLGGDRTITLINMRPGGTYLLKLIQDGTGTRVPIFVNVNWPGNTAPTYTITPDEWDNLSFVGWDESTVDGVVGGQAYQAAP